jgi:carboxyl-terminal processing protease
MIRRLVALYLLFAAACGGSGVGSIGAVLGRDDDTHAVFVREVPRGLAADRAGLLPGDEIVMIDGVYVRELGTKELRELLRGDVGGAVKLTILRGEGVRHITVTRSEFRAHETAKPREEKISE